MWSIFVVTMQCSQIMNSSKLNKTTRRNRYVFYGCTVSVKSKVAYFHHLRVFLLAAMSYSEIELLRKLVHAKYKMMLARLGPIENFIGCVARFEKFITIQNGNFSDVLRINLSLDSVIDLIKLWQGQIKKVASVSTKIKDKIGIWVNIDDTKVEPSLIIAALGEIRDVVSLLMGDIKLLERDYAIIYCMNTFYFRLYKLDRRSNASDLFNDLLGVAKYFQRQINELASSDTKMAICTTACITRMQAINISQGGGFPVREVIDSMVHLIKLHRSLPEMIVQTFEGDTDDDESDAKGDTEGDESNAKVDTEGDGSDARVDTDGNESDAKGATEGDEDYSSHCVSPRKKRRLL
jgi:hypothetical protein